jgi:hypothetical protein
MGIAGRRGGHLDGRRDSMTDSWTIDRVCDSVNQIVDPSLQHADYTPPSTRVLNEMESCLRQVLTEIDVMLHIIEVEKRARWLKKVIGALEEAKDGASED